MFVSYFNLLLEFTLFYYIIFVTSRKFSAFENNNKKKWNNINKIIKNLIKLKIIRKVK